MLTRATAQLRRFGLLSLAPGLVDAGFGSLAGLSGSLYAARFFDLGQLGLFSLFFLAFQLLGMLPSRLLLVPAQVAALDLPIRDRASILERSVPLGFVAGLATMPLVAIVVLIGPGGDRSDYIAFGVTTAIMVLLSPLQDHCRFMLHMSERSVAAAMVSAVQFVVAVGALLAMHLLDIPERWIPFLALSMANAASLAFALAVARPRLAPDAPWPGSRALFASGKLVLPATTLPTVGMLGAAALVGHLASADALGSAEAARVVASPVLVVGTGLGQIIWPRIMAASRQNDHLELASAARLQIVVVVVFVAGYIALFGWPHPWNVMEWVVPLAFSVSGLVAFRVIAMAGTVLGNLPMSALLAQGDNRGLLVAAALTVAAQLTTALALATTIEAHAVPAAQLVGTLTGALLLTPRVPGLLRVLNGGRA